MGPAHDPMAVVDHRLRLVGLDRLRIVDASVTPTITSGNTNAPRDRLIGHPQQREHSDGVAGTRDRVPPARGSTF